MEAPLYLTEEQVEEIMTWDDLVDIMELAFADVSAKNPTSDRTIIQPIRGILDISHKKGVLVTMPGYSEREKVLCCKLATAFYENMKNFNMPSIMATIAVFNTDTGMMEAMLAGTTITAWRTAAASIVATRAIKPSFQTEQTLAVVGAGRQIRTHILAFQHFYKFKKIHMWNRTFANAEKVANEYRDKYNIKIKVFSDINSATKDADMIISATYATEPLFRIKDIKRGVHINAIGVGDVPHAELHPDIYKKSAVYVDSMECAQKELKGLYEQGLLCAEVGELVNKTAKVKDAYVTIFQSLGMAVEDAVAAKYVVTKHQKKQKVKPTMCSRV